MTAPRVLVGCPTSYRHSHSIRQFIACLNELTYPCFDVLFVDETEGEKFAGYLRNKGYNVVRSSPKSEAKIGRIIENRNIIIDYCIKNNYDFLFFLDTDVIPPKDVIERLVSHNKDIISGVYLANQIINSVPKVLPVLRGLSGYKDFSRPVEMDEIKENRVFEIFGCGFGCCLIKRAVLEKVKLRFNLCLNSSEDFLFCYDARVQHSFRTYADTSVKCIHMAGSGTYNF